MRSGSWRHLGWMVLWVACAWAAETPADRAAEETTGPDLAARLKTIRRLATSGGAEAVPPLLKALQDSDWLVRSAAVRALGKLHPPQAFPALRRVLTDKNVYVRLETVRALCAFGTEGGAEVHRIIANPREDVRIVNEGLRAMVTANSPQAGPALTEAATHRNVEVRLTAMEQIGRLGSAGHQQVLLDAFTDSDRRVRQLASSALVDGLGTRATPIFCAVLADGPMPSRLTAMEALLALEDPVSVPALTRALSDTNRSFRSKVVEALGRFGGPAAVPALMEALKKRAGSSQDRLLLIKALGRTGDPQVVKALEPFVSRHSYSTRRAAVMAIAQVADAASEERLVRLMQHSYSRIRAAAAGGLARIGGEKAIATLLERLPKDARNVVVLPAIVEALAHLRVRKAAPELLNLLPNARRTKDRAAIALALGWIGDATAVEPLLETLKHNQPSVRAGAAAGLGLLGRPEVVPKLLRAYHQEDDADVRRELLLSLGRLGDAAGADLLLRVLSQGPPELRLAAAEALGWTGLARAVEPLAKAAAAGEKEVRRASVLALADIPVAKAREALRGQLTNSDPDAAEVAALALGVLADKGATESLRKVLADGSGPVQVAAAWALARLGQKDGEAQLKQSLTAAQAEVRSLAAAGLVLLGDKSVLPHLREMLWNARLPLSPYRLIVAQALGTFDRPEATKFLHRHVQDLDEDDRAAARFALAELGDKTVVVPLGRMLVDPATRPDLRRRTAAAIGELIKKTFDPTAEGADAAAKWWNEEGKAKYDVTEKEE